MDEPMSEWRSQNYRCSRCSTIRLFLLVMESTASGSSTAGTTTPMSLMHSNRPRFVGHAVNHSLAPHGWPNSVPIGSVERDLHLGLVREPAVVSAPKQSRSSRRSSGYDSPEDGSQGSVGLRTGTPAGAFNVASLSLTHQESSV